MADEAKAKGNAAYSAGDYEAAITHFTEAINLAPTNHVLYSNRSASYASLNRYSDALSDAKKTVELKPDWVKGYSRLGAAHHGLAQFDDAVSAYNKGLEIDPNNAALKEALAESKSARDRAAARASRPPPSSNPFGDAFSGPQMWAKLTADPSTRAFMQQPDFVNMMQEIQKNPTNLNLYLKDQRVMQALGVLLNVKLQGGGGASEDDDMPDFPAERTRSAAEATEPPQRKPEPEPEPMDVPEEEKEAKKRKAGALKEKEAGNAAYKKKDFDSAIQHYTKAMEIDDEDISYLLNRAATYLEMGQVWIAYCFWSSVWFMLCRAEYIYLVLFIG